MGEMFFFANVFFCKTNWCDCMAIRLRFLAILFFFAMVPLLSHNISIIGTGRLGLTYALCLENAGHNILAVDVSPNLIDMLNQKSFKTGEPGINEMLVRSQHFHATTSLKEALDFSHIILIVVSTTNGTEGYNFHALTDLLKEINAQKVENKHLVIHSTVSPGYIQNTARLLLRDCKNVTISYNPPFIAQGEIVKGLVTPDMVLIGQATKEVGDLLESLHRSIVTNDPPFARVSVESAEIAKLALNCFLTSKIAFANLVGDIADETPGADKYEILKAIGCDSRVGSKYMIPGYGFGGPCFIRDNHALAEYANLVGIDPVIFKATDSANDQHAIYMAEKWIEQDLDEYFFEDVSFKPNCPVKIIYASQKLAVARLIAEQGKHVTIVDTQRVIDEVKALYGNLFNYVVSDSD
jgi:UDPglucose 6-dehydrogenase